MLGGDKMTIEKLLEYVKQEYIKNIKLCHIIKESYLEDTFIKKCVILSRYKSYINGYKCGNKDNNIDDLRMIECADMIDAALQNMKKPVESIIECNKEYFKTLSDIKEIYIIGHSLNRIDLPYFKEIKDNVKDNVEWLLFFKDKHDYSKNLKEKKEVFQKLGIDSKKVHFKIDNINSNIFFLLLSSTITFVLHNSLLS